MKKCLAGLVLLLTTISGAAQAEITPYVGADLQYRCILLRDIPKNFFTKKAPSYGAYVGARWQMLGFELGGHAFNHSQNFSRTKGHGFSASMLGYLEAHELVDVIGVIGANQVVHKYEQPNYWIKIKGPNPRFGVGFEVKLNDYLSWRNLGLWESKVTLRNVSEVPRGSLAFSSGLKVDF